MDNVVDEKVNQVVESGKGVSRVTDGPGYEMPLLLFAGFRSIIDRLHTELAEQGHPEVRPAYGFAMQAIGRDGATASEIGRRLGVTKQAAGKTIDKLEHLGYAERADDPADARRKVVRLTARGFDSLGRSAAIFEDLRKDWVDVLGADRVRALEADLRAMAPTDGFRLDVAGWFGG